MGPGDRVVEIGAGLGSLTRALAETGASVTAVEVDRGLVPVLREEVEPLGVRVIEGDALRLDYGSLLDGDGWVLVANLPYNVATPLVADLLDGVPAIERMLVMVQREVGERLAAGPGDDAYGAVSVKVASWATAELVGKVPPTVFLPRPKVESALVAIRRTATPVIPPDVDRAPGCSSSSGPGSGSAARCCGGRSPAGPRPEQLEQAGIRPEARAEELSIQDWVALTRVVERAG